MCTVGPNDNLWLIEVTGMQCMVATCLMTVILFFLDNGGFVGQHEGKMKNWRFYSHGNFEDKNHRFTCLLRSERCNSFPKHLDLAMTPNKTNEGVQKQ